MACPPDFARNEQEGPSFYVCYPGDRYGGSCPFDVCQNNPWEGGDIRLEGSIVEMEGIPTEGRHSNHYGHTAAGAKLYS